MSGILLHRGFSSKAGTASAWEIPRRDADMFESLARLSNCVGRRV